MAWHGKAIGAGLGTVVGGPVGTVIGAWVGHAMDNDAEEQERLNEQALAEAQAEHEARLALFAIFVSATHVDGIIHANERRRLKTLAEALFGPGFDQEVDQWIDDIHGRRFTAAECAEVLRALPEAMRPQVLRDVMSVFCADDDFSPAESTWAEELVYRTGFDPALWMFLHHCYCREAADPKERIRHLVTLGLGANASEEDVRRAYRQLASEFHPDRHQGVTRALRDLAENQLKDINEAYRCLTRPARESLPPGHAALVSAGSPLEAERLVGGGVTLCGLCQTRNRLPEREHHHKARCGVCFAFLVLPRPVLEQLIPA